MAEEALELEPDRPTRSSATSDDDVENSEAESGDEATGTGVDPATVRTKGVSTGVASAAAALAGAEAEAVAA